MLSGITATGGGLVLTGDLNGDLLALNGANGKQLWKQNTGSPIGGGVIRYLPNGKQYVGVATGMTAKTWQAQAGNAKVVVYGLP